MNFHAIRSGWTLRIVPGMSYSHARSADSLYSQVRSSYANAVPCVHLTTMSCSSALCAQTAHLVDGLLKRVGNLYEMPPDVSTIR
jgi:hypothetical protein